MKLSKKGKLISVGIAVCAILLATPYVLYLKALPWAVQNPKVINSVSSVLKKQLDVDLVVKNPELATSLKPFVEFKVANVTLSKDKKEIVCLDNFGINLSLQKIFEKRIVLNKLGADRIAVDAEAIMKLLPQPKNEKSVKNKPSDWVFDLYDAKMFVKDCSFKYNTHDTNILLRGRNFEINNQDEKNYVHFQFFIELKKNNKRVLIAAADKNSVLIENKQINVKDLALIINNSKIIVNAKATKEKHYVEAVTNNFNIEDIIEIVGSNLIISNGSMMLEGFKDLKGSFNSKITLIDKKIDGRLDLNNFSCKLIPVNNLPLFVNSGTALINNQDITLKDFSGYYGSSKVNSFKASGGIFDYFNTAKTVITADANVTNDFTANYLSKVVGYPFTIIGNGESRTIFEALGNKMDLTFMFKLGKGADFLVDGTNLSPINYDRAVKAVMHFVGDNLNIETINYYIANELKEGSKVVPILKLDGNVRITDGFIKDFGFNIPKPLPSEFLNVFLHEKVFQKGTISGNVRYLNTGIVPKIDGNMKLSQIRIPAQRIYINEASLNTDNNSILLNSNGRYRKTKYDVRGDLANELKLPIVVNSVNLKIDELNIEQILSSMNEQTSTNEINKDAFKNVKEMDDDDDSNVVAFNPGMIIIKECIFDVLKGSYKDINFANFKSNLTLNDKGVLKVASNGFEMAGGISSAKIECDLVNHLYHVMLGVRDVDSDIMATSILNLPREMSGKATGYVNLGADETLKINGKIKFDVKNGTIQKIGLVEYVLKFTSLFRNPLAMISPATVVDLVNIPEGKFDNISGEIHLKDNVIENMKIKSSASQLSSYIVGRFDLEKHDATLRIYTKMSNKQKGFSGILRNFSLNSLANRVPMSGRNDSNYYASELVELPKIDAEEKDCQIFLTKVDGDVEHNNFLSSLKRIK